MFIRLQLIDWRVEFSKWWLTEFKTVKIPLAGGVFNYFIDPETNKFQPWSDLVLPFELDTDIPLQVSHMSRDFKLFSFRSRPNI